MKLPFSMSREIDSFTQNKCHSKINAKVWGHISKGIKLLNSLRRSIFVISSNVSCAEKKTVP